MPEELDTIEVEVSDAMSEPEYDDPDVHIKEDEDDSMTGAHAKLADGADGAGKPEKKYDPKDPLRPRRKKARRACYACQRAHLTCGMPQNHLSSSSLVSFSHVCFPMQVRCRRSRDQAMREQPTVAARKSPRRDEPRAGWPP